MFFQSIFFLFFLLLNFSSSKASSREILERDDYEASSGLVANSAVDPEGGSLEKKLSQKFDLLEKYLEKNQLDILNNPIYKEDLLSICKYLKIIDKNKINTEKFLISDVNKITLHLGAKDFVFSPSFESVFLQLPTLKNFVIVLKISKELTPEEYKASLEASKSNCSFISLQTFQPSSYHPFVYEQYQIKSLLWAFLRRNALLNQSIISLSNNYSLTKNQTDIFAEGLAKNVSLEEMSLMFHEPCERLIKNLKLNRSIKRLNLSFFVDKDPFLSPDETESFVDFSCQSIVLEHLFLHANFSCFFLDEFSKVLSSEAVPLKKLELSSSYQAKNKNIPEKFLKNIESNKTLTLLQLEGFRISKNGLYVFSNSLKKNNNIKILILKSLNLKEKGFSVLCPGLKENSSIEEIDLSNNGLSDKSGFEIVDLLENNSVIKHINLYDMYSLCSKGPKISEANKLKIQKLLSQRRESSMVYDIIL